MEWTSDQSNVIASRGENLLVSAAAGSGKTAVLVERLISRILDKNDPADIDSFLVVTFTRAAAAEMKERISKRILKELERDPGNSHLMRQLTYVNHAKITTIDSFCSWVVRSYAPLIDLDMSFRVMNEGEGKLMEADAMRRVMEEAHEEAAHEDPTHGAEDHEEVDRGQEGSAPKDEDAGSFAEDFYAFLETYASGKDEKQAEELIREVYKAAMSLPYPEDFYALCREKAEGETIDDIMAMPCMAGFWESFDSSVKEGTELTEKGLEILACEGAPGTYAKAFEAYRTLFEKLASEGHHYEALFEAVRECEIPRAAGGKPRSDEDPALRESLKSLKDRIEAIRTSLKTRTFPCSPEIAVRARKATAGPVNMLVTMAERFGEALSEEKRRKNVLDFNDLEHMALKILRQDRQRTAAAREIAAGLREVLIDEYQDSNYLQEEILTAVSSLEDGVDNYFCVGDVKQSIYSFRNARPDLFMRKFYNYRTDGPGDSSLCGGPEEDILYSETGQPLLEDKPYLKGRRIDLHCNFRSRPELLDGVNAIFKRIMRREVGGVDYDDAASLLTGTTQNSLCLPDGRENGHKIEVFTVFTDEEDEEGSKVLDETNAKAQIELEGRTVAAKIRDLVESGRITGEDGASRPVEYRDIVILLRTIDGVAGGFKTSLEAAGIPVVLQEKKGFFKSSEVKTVLSFLQIVDNPRQDIPLSSAMTSVIGGFTAEDLAEIRTDGRLLLEQEAAQREEGPACLNYYDYLEAYGRIGPEMELRARCRQFLSLVGDYRRRASFTPIHELMAELLAETGLKDYAAALPNGLQRSANLRILIESAVAYEQTSYVGLFNFVRYVTSLEDQKEEMEAAAIGENENAVRIISIHKSKGLEYPIVFVCRLGAKINLKDLSGPVLIDPEFGLASDYIDYTGRVTYPTLKKEAFKQKKVIDAVGEELRILYVAMTRAKLKLYLVGTAKDPETLEKKWSVGPERSTGFLPAGYLAEAKSRWDLLMPAILGSDDIIKVPVFPTELIGNEAAAGKALDSRLEKIRRFDPETVADPAARASIEERFGYVYPFEDHKDIPAKISVSEIKMAHIEADDESGFTPFEEADVVPLIPAFLQEDQSDQAPQIKGAAVGTAYHRFLSRLDLTDERAGTIEGLRAQLDSCAAGGFLSETEAAAIDLRKILLLLESPVGKRLKAADSRSKLKREQPFTMRVKASEVREDWPEDESVLIQGIIDVYFEEDGRFYVLDYKTDRVTNDDELADRYRVQIELYARAIETATGKTVAGKYLYSFSLGRTIEVLSDQ